MIDVCDCMRLQLFNFIVTQLFIADAFVKKKLHKN